MGDGAQVAGGPAVPAPVSSPTTQGATTQDVSTKPHMRGRPRGFAHTTESPVGFHTKYTSCILCSVKAPGSQSQSTNGSRC